MLRHAGVYYWCAPELPHVILLSSRSYMQHESRCLPVGFGNLLQRLTRNAEPGFGESKAGKTEPGRRYGCAPCSQLTVPCVCPAVSSYKAPKGRVAGTAVSLDVLQASVGPRGCYRHTRVLLQGPPELAQ